MVGIQLPGEHVDRGWHCQERGPADRGVDDAWKFRQVLDSVSPTS